MRKIIVIVLVVLSSLLSVAQTQQGYVKTKGRLGNDGQVIAGVRLAEATISLSDQKIVSQESGAFSFEVSNKKYTICDVLKEGYMCYDDDQLGEYEYSSKPLILVIERSDEHKSDKQQAKQKLSRIMSSQLQQRRNELEKLKDDNTITQQEYQRLRNHLYSSSDNNDHLIESMAERYASLDFDQMDEEDRMIKNLILNGELNKVDSIINAKGNLEDRITLYKTHKEVSKHVRQENVIRKNRFNNEDIVDNELREIAEDCMNKFELYKLKCLFDSAAYYIQMRAELDSLNYDWQYSAAKYLGNQGFFASSEKYLGRSMNIIKELAKRNPKTYEADLAGLYYSLGALYYLTKRFVESMEFCKSSLAILERLAKDNPKAYEADLADLYNILAVIYLNTQRFVESEEFCKSSLAIRKRLAKENPQGFESDLISTYNDLATLYKKSNRFVECEEMYKSALEISENLAKNNPKDYEQTLAQSYENLADLYEDTQRISESEEMYKSALAIYMHLAQENPQRYESNLAWSYNNLAIIYYNTQRYVESESMYKAALELFLHLYDINPQNWDFTLMNCYYWLGNTMIQIEKLNEAKEHLIKSLSLARQMTKDGNKYSIHWLSLYYLSAIHSQEKDYSSAYNNNEELLPILNAYYKDDAERWKANYSSQLVSQSFCAILLGKFKEGEQYSLEALKVDSTKQLAYTNLAAALLLQGKVVEAETLYIQYKAEFKKDFLSDFSEFERLGIVPEERKKDVERIKAMLIAYTPL